MGILFCCATKPTNQSTANPGHIIIIYSLSHGPMKHLLRNTPTLHFKHNQQAVVKTCWQQLTSTEVQLGGMEQESDSSGACEIPDDRLIIKHINAHSLEYNIDELQVESEGSRCGNSEWNIAAYRGISDDSVSTEGIQIYRRLDQTADLWNRLKDT